MKESIGMIETIGITGAIRAADMMVKCAYVEILKIEKIGSGHVVVIVKGDIASVEAALEIGGLEAQSTGELVAVHGIAKPFDGVEKLFSAPRREDNNL